MDKHNFKDNPKFLIISSVLVPIAVSLIGLAGIILPNLTSQPNNPTTSNDTISKPTEEQPTVTVPEKIEDTFGYLSLEGVQSQYNALSITLSPNKSEGFYEIQRINNEYFLLGFVDKFELNNLKISASQISTFKNVIAIKLSDVTNMKAETVKEKKNEYKVLAITSKSFRTDLPLH